MKALVGHDNSSQRQVRLRHTNWTGRSKHGASTTRDVAAPVAVRDHPARRAAHHRRRRLDIDREQPDVAVEHEARDMQAIEADEHVATRAVGRVVMAARSDARRRLEQRRGLPAGQLGRYRSWRPRLLSPGDHAATGAPLNATGIRQSPFLEQLARKTRKAFGIAIQESRL